MSEKRRIISNTLANGIAQFTAMLSSLIFMPLLIRSFGVSEFGLFLLASSVAAYASLADFGVGTALVKNIAEHAASEDRKGMGQYISAALMFYIAVGVLVALVVAALAFTAGSIFNVTADGARLLRNLLLVVALTSLWTWPGSTANYVLAGLQRYTLSARTAFGVAIANVGVILAVLYTHQGPLALLVGQSIVALGGMVANVALARRVIGEGVTVHPSQADRAVFRDILSFSWVIFVLQLCTLILYQQTDRVVLGVFLGASAITLYESAGRMQGLVTQLNGFATSAVMPFASQLSAEGRENSTQTLFYRGTKYVMALVLPIVVGLMILARPIITAWLGPAFATQSLAAQILLSFQLLTVGAVIGEAILIARGAARKRLTNSLLVTLGNLVLSVVLVQRMGILGVVLGTTIPWFIDFPMRLRVSLNEVGAPFREWLTRSAGPVYLSLLPTVAVALLAYRTPLVDSLFGLALTMLLGIAVCWGSLAAFALTPVERSELTALVHRLARR